jgi:hypothetical protein
MKTIVAWICDEEFNLTPVFMITKDKTKRTKKKLIKKPKDGRKHEIIK